MSKSIVGTAEKIFPLEISWITELNDLREKTHLQRIWFAFKV